MKADRAVGPISLASASTVMALLGSPGHVAAQAIADCPALSAGTPVAIYGVVAADGSAVCYDALLPGTFAVQMILWDLESDGHYHNVASSATYLDCGWPPCTINAHVQTAVYPPKGTYHSQILVYLNGGGPDWSANSSGTLTVK